jgi:hypothetical protein
MQSACVWLLCRPRSPDLTRSIVHPRLCWCDRLSRRLDEQSSPGPRQIHLRQRKSMSDATDTPHNILSARPCAPRRLASTPLDDPRSDRLCRDNGMRWKMRDRFLLALHHDTVVIAHITSRSRQCIGADSLSPLNCRCRVIRRGPMEEQSDGWTREAVVRDRRSVRRTPQSTTRYIYVRFYSVADL